MRRRGGSLLAAVTLVALAALTGCSGGSPAYQGPSAADLAAQASFDRAVAAVSWPAGMTDDPTLTSCGGLTTRCARTAESPRDAVTELSALVGKAGGPTRPITCGPERSQPVFLGGEGAVGCATQATHGPAMLDIRAWDRFTLSPASSGHPAQTLRLGYTAVAILAPSATIPSAAAEDAAIARATPVARPLTAAELAALPASWGHPTCDVHVRGRCADARLFVPVSVRPVDATRVFAVDLLHSGFGIREAWCSPGPASRPGFLCQVVAARLRHAGDTGQAFAIGQFRQGNATDSGLVGIGTATPRS